MKIEVVPFSVTKSKIQDMHLKFAIVQQKQEQYFQTEKTILDAIWAATDNAWYKWQKITCTRYYLLFIQASISYEFNAGTGASSTGMQSKRP